MMVSSEDNVTSLSLDLFDLDAYDNLIMEIASCIDSEDDCQDLLKLYTIFELQTILEANGLCAGNKRLRKEKFISTICLLYKDLHKTRFSSLAVVKPSISPSAMGNDEIEADLAALKWIAGLVDSVHTSPLQSDCISESDCYRPELPVSLQEDMKSDNFHILEGAENSNDFAESMALQKPEFCDTASSPPRKKYKYLHAIMNSAEADTSCSFQVSASSPPRKKHKHVHEIMNSVEADSQQSPQVLG